MAIGADAQNALANGLLLEIRTDTVLKDKLIASDQEIREMIPPVLSVDPILFGGQDNTTEIKLEVSKLAESLSDFTSAIKEKRTHFPHEVLLQLDLEADLFRDILLGLLKNPPILNKDVSTRLAAISSDFEIKSRGLGETRGIDTSPERWPSVRVVVRTLKPGKIEAPDYRIHCVPKALLDVRRIAIPNLSCPQKGI